MPFLIPAPDFTPKQLQDLRITGTCEVQICRSVGPWSMGITHVEHSVGLLRHQAALILRN